MYVRDVELENVETVKESFVRSGKITAEKYNRIRPNADCL